MKKVKGITNRIVAMLMSGMLVVGAVPGTVLASENQADIGQTSEITAEVPEGTDAEEVSAEAYSQDAVIQEAEASEEEAAQYYTVILDANGGYFENEWDDALGETVEQVEVVEKQIPVGGTVAFFPVFIDQDGRSRTFAGWSLERDGELVSQAEEEYIPLDNCILYAMWQAEDTIPGETEGQEVDDEENTEQGDAVQNSEEVEDASDETLTAEEGAVEEDTAFEANTDPETENEQDNAPDQESVPADEDAENISEDSSDAAEAEEETQPELNESSEEEETVREDASKEIVESGTSGDNLTWTLDNEGTLTISGTGEMTDFPWLEYYTYIKKVIINNGVTSIKSDAFKNCSWIKSVTIPNSVVSIGNYAFKNCVSLESVAIPNSVVSIGDEAFATCGSLSSLTIHDGVTSIGYDAFAGCNDLTSVIIPDSVTSIGYNAFCDCTNLTSVTISDGLEQIEDGVFSRCSLTSVTIPDSVTSIGDSAFWGCSLTSVAIPDSVTSIGDKAFYGNALTSVTIPKSVTSIGNETFRNCSSLKNVTMQKGLTRIGNSAFDCCKSLTSVTIPETVKNIGMKAFYGCQNLSSVTIPGNVAFIGDDAFLTYSEALTSLTVYGSVTSYGLSVFRTCKSLKSVIIQDGVESIGDSAFSYFDTLTSITIPNSVLSIGDSAFSGCSDLSSLTIPDSVTSIGNKAFSGCTSLTSMKIPRSVTEIGSSAFSGCTSLTNVTIPISVASIGSSAFSNCTSLTNVTIPAGVTSIGEYTFSGCTGLKSVVISAGVTSIGYSAFSGCTNLTSIEIPDSITTIGNCAFSGCSSLPSITIPDSVTEIGSSAFEGCSRLTSVTIPDSVTSIGFYTFSDCSNLTSVAIGNSVTSIENSAFSGCSRLTSVTIGNSVMSIESDAFYKCSSLTSVKIPDSVTSIKNFAFNGSGLTSVTIPASVTSIGSSAFSDCSSLKDIYYGAGKADWEKIFRDILSGVTIHYNSTGPAEPIEPSEDLNEILPTFELSKDTISFKNNSFGDELRLNLKAKNVLLDEESDSLTQEQKDSLCFHVTVIDFEINGTPVAYFTKTGDIYTQNKSIVPMDNGLDIPINEEKQLADFEILTNPPVIIDSPTQVAKISFTMKGTINGNPVEVKDEKTVTFLYDFFEDTEYIDLTEDFNDGMLNSLAYLMDNGNFPAASFAMIDENDIGSQVVKDVTDLLYRGWDGRKELIWGELSTEDAEQILIDLINDIDVDIKGFAKVNTAKGFADLLTEGFKDWCLLEGNQLVDESGIKDIIQNIDLDVTNKQIQELLKNGKFDTMAVLVWDDDENGPQLRDLFIKYCNSLQNAEKFSKVLKGFGTGSKILSLGMGTIQNYYNLKSLAAADEMYLAMLLYLRDHCSYKPVSNAAGNLYKIINDETKEVGYLFKDITEEVNAYVIGKGVEACTPLISAKIGIAENKLLFLAAAKYGYKTGVFLSNTILHTSDSQALKDRLHSLSHIGLSLSKWAADAQKAYFASSGSEKKENIKKVAYGQYMLLKTRMLGEKTYQRLLEMYHQNSSESHRVSVFISSVLDGQAEYLAENGIFLKMKGIGVFCPVDVDLVDENNNVLVSVSDGEEMSGRIGDIFYWAYYNPDEDDYSKVILYPQDRNYSIKIQGNDTGNVTALFTEFDDDGAAKCLSMTEVKVDDQTVISLDHISASSEFYTVIDNENTYEGKLESTIQRELASYETPTESCVHDFGYWSILRQATTFANGKKVRYCKKCGFENLEDIEMAAQSITADDLSLTLPGTGIIFVSGNQGNLTFASDNTDIAEVDASGNVTAKGVGTANITITAEATDNYMEATKTITVTVAGSAYYAVTMDANGGVINNETDDDTGREVTNAKTVTKYIAEDRYAFIPSRHVQNEDESLFLTGWALSPDGDPVTGFNESFKPDSDCTLYAVWKHGKPAGTMRYGDLNYNGILDGGDGIKIQRHNKAYNDTSVRAKHPDWIMTGYEYEAADINHDAVINGADYMLLIRDIAARNNEETQAGHPDWIITETFTIYSFDEIEPISIEEASVTGITSKAYTGNAITQELVVKIGDTILEKDIDYTIAYSNNINVGTATVTITGKGNYKGTASADFKINKSAQSITAKAVTSPIAVGKATIVSVTGAEGTKSFKSSDTTIATVDSKTGKVTARKVGTVKITATSAATENYNAASKTVTIKVVPAAVSSYTAANLATGIKLTWKKVTGANGYKVYRGKTLIKTVKNGAALTCTDTKANSNGAKYTFMIVPKSAYGDGAAKIITIYRVAGIVTFSVKNNASKRMTVRWNRNARASGYQILYSRNKSFSSGNKAVNVTNAATVSKVIGSLTKGRTYYVKIRSFKKVGGTRYWSVWSSARSVKISK